MTTQTEALKMALEALEKAEESVRMVERLGMRLGLSDADLRMDKETVFKPAITAIKAALEAHKALAQQCVCGEPNTAGTHRTDGPCLAPQPEQEPVEIYQYKMGDGSWIDQEKHSYDYNKRYAPNATVRVVYTTPPQRKE